MYEIGLTLYLLPACNNNNYTDMVDSQKTLNGANFSPPPMGNISVGSRTVIYSD